VPGIFAPVLRSDRGWGVEWILRLSAAGGEGHSVDIMEISRPDDLGDIANLGLTLTEAKQLLARVQCEISTAQARQHAVRRPVCPCREDVCRVKDYRDHSVATLFGPGLAGVDASMRRLVTTLFGLATLLRPSLRG
jgi:hypothetical protein